jgi:hypothetical protein
VWALNRNAAVLAPVSWGFQVTLAAARPHLICRRGTNSGARSEPYSENPERRDGPRVLALVTAPGGEDVVMASAVPNLDQGNAWRERSVWPPMEGWASKGCGFGWAGQKLAHRWGRPDDVHGVIRGIALWELKRPKSVAMRALRSAISGDHGANDCRKPRSPPLPRRGGRGFS